MYARSLVLWFQANKKRRIMKEKDKTYSVSDINLYGGCFTSLFMFYHLWNIVITNNHIPFKLF